MKQPLFKCRSAIAKKVGQATVETTQVAETKGYDVRVRKTATTQLVKVVFHQRKLIVGNVSI